MPAQLDALITARLGAVTIILSKIDWRAIMTDPAGAPSRQTLDSGQVAYRGITVWVAFPGRVPVLDAAEITAEGLS